MIEYHHDGEWIRELEHIKSLYMYMEYDPLCVDFDDLEISMSFEEKRLKIKEYKVSIELL